MSFASPTFVLQLPRVGRRPSYQNFPHSSSVRQGFTAVCFEGDWPFFEAANAYINGKRATPFPLDGEGGRFPKWMWHNVRAACTGSSRTPHQPSCS